MTAAVLPTVIPAEAGIHCPADVLTPTAAVLPTVIPAEAGIHCPADALTPTAAVLPTPSAHLAMTPAR